MKKWNYYNDFDPNVCAWAKELIRKGLVPDGEVDCRPIEQIQPEELTGFIQHHFFCGILGWPLALQLAGWGADRPVWTASFPCQPVSVAGSKRGAEDDRYLLPQGIRLITECRPACVLGEQVPSLEWVDAASHAMADAGYSFWPDIRRADSVGAFQERRRLYWAATPNSNGKRQPQPWQRKQDTKRNAANEFREADRLVDAFRREALPFLCGGHDGVSARVGQVCCKGFGNAIIPQVAAEFIAEIMEVAA